MIRLLILLQLIALTSLVNGQEEVMCLTSLHGNPHIDPAEFQEWRQNRSNSRSAKISIGITIHIVEEVAGATNIDIDRLYEELDLVNRYFTFAGIEFFYCGSPRIIRGGRQSYTYATAATELNQRHHVDNTINIFYLDEISDPQLSFAACGISTFPFNSSPRSRFIIMQKDCSTNGAILAHEIGHFFGLLHTHETAVGIELVDGSNCGEAGDLICDTPADPNLSFTGLNGCTYTANFVDANGDIFSPDPTNIMSYAPSFCQNRFTPGQDEVMNFWYDTELSYLLSDCDFYPDFAISSEENNQNINSGHTFDLDYSFNNEGISEDYELVVHFTLTEIDGDGAIVPVIYRDTIAIQANSGQLDLNFSFPFPIAKGSGTYELTAILDPNSTIIERDKRNNFHTLIIEVDNSNLADYSIFPNPADDFIRIFIRDSRRGGEVSLEVSDLLGRQYGYAERFKIGDELIFDFDVSTLDHGPYILTVFFARHDELESFLFLKN